MKVTLIEFGKVNKNGRTYMFHQISDLPKLVICTLDASVDEHGHAILSPPINGKNSCASANIIMDSFGIYAEVRPYANQNGKIFEEMMMNGCSIVPAGTGNLNEKGEVEDYRLHYIFLTKDPS